MNFITVHLATASGTAGREHYINADTISFFTEGDNGRNCIIWFTNKEVRTFADPYESVKMQLKKVIETP